jgi:hypothetical protein
MNFEDECTEGIFTQKHNQLIPTKHIKSYGEEKQEIHMKRRVLRSAKGPGRIPERITELHLRGLNQFKNILTWQIRIIF